MARIKWFDMTTDRSKSCSKMETNNWQVKHNVSVPEGWIFVILDHWHSGKIPSFLLIPGKKQCHFSADACGRIREATMRFSNMGAEALTCVVSWNYAYVSQLYVDITIFRLFTFLKNLHWNAIQNKKTLLHVESCALFSRWSGPFCVSGFDVCHPLHVSGAIWGMVNLNTSMDLHHQTVRKPHFYWTHPPTNPSRPQSLHTPSTAVSLKQKKKGATPKRIASNQRRKISIKPVASSSGPTIISDSIVHWFAIDKTTTSTLKSYVEKSASRMSWKCCSPLAAHCFNSNSCRSLLLENIPAPFFFFEGWPPHQQELSECWRGAVFHRDCLWQADGKLYNFWPQRIPCWTGDLW